MNNYKEKLKENPWKALEEDGLLSKAASTYSQKLGDTDYSTSARHANINSGLYMLELDSSSLEYEIHILEGENLSTNSSEDISIMEFQLNHGHDLAYHNFVETFQELAGFEDEETFKLDDRYFFMLYSKK